MPLLLFQIALVLIFLYSVYQAFLAVQKGGSNYHHWVDFTYHASWAVASLWFFLEVTK